MNDKKEQLIEKYYKEIDSTIVNVISEISNIQYKARYDKDLTNKEAYMLYELTEEIITELKEYISVPV